MKCFQIDFSFYRMRFRSLDMTLCLYDDMKTCTYDKQWWAGQELFITRSEQCRHPYITCRDLHAQPWYCAIPSRAVRYEPKANGPWSIPQKNITQPTQSLLCITHPTPLIAPCNEPTTKIEKCQMLFEGQSRVKPSENSLSSATGRSRCNNTCHL